MLFIAMVFSRGKTQAFLVTKAVLARRVCQSRWFFAGTSAPGRFYWQDSELLLQGNSWFISKNRYNSPGILSRCLLLPISCKTLSTSVQECQEREDVLTVQTVAPAAKEAKECGRDCYTPEINATENGVIKDALVLNANDSDNSIVVQYDEGSLDDTDLDKEFYDFIESEDNIDELLSMLMEMEENLPPEDPRVCCTCLRLAELHNDTGGNPEKIIDYARQAYHNYDESRYPIQTAKSLLMIGIAHCKMAEFKESISPLEKSADILEKLDIPKERSKEKQKELTSLQYNVKTMLGQAKLSLGWINDGLLDFQNGLMIIEAVLGPDDWRLGACYQQVSEAYLQTKNPDKALEMIQKAFTIIEKQHGSSSYEVASLRSTMMQIYFERNDYENALCEGKLAATILQSLGKTEEAMNLHLESMEALFQLGKFNEAIIKLNDIVMCTEEENPLHLEALVMLIRAHANLKEDMAAANYCTEALNILEKREPSLESTKTLLRLSMAYEQLKNYEQAMVVIQRALAYLKECPNKEATVVAADVESYAGSIYMSMKKPNEAVRYLLRSLARKKNINGPDSLELSSGYCICIDKKL